MNVRKILSARAARPQVEGMMEALVHAAVFIGGSDGRFGEDELNVFIDTMREVVSSAVGEESLDALAATGKLLDLARRARHELNEQGPAPFLKNLAERFPSHFARDGLVLAYRIVLADEKVTEREAEAFKALAGALGVEVAETKVLEQLAKQSEAASRGGHRGSSIEALRSLESKGWQLTKGDHFDAGVSFAKADGAVLALELDSGESALHVHINGANGQGPHLVCFFGDALPALLTVIDAVKGELLPATMGEKLPVIRAVCSELFLEHEGKFAKL